MRSLRLRWGEPRDMRSLTATATLLRCTPVQLPSRWEQRS